MLFADSVIYSPPCYSKHTRLPFNFVNTIFLIVSQVHRTRTHKKNKNRHYPYALSGLIQVV